jgi:Ca2+-binding EF-hand superfamily protein
MALKIQATIDIHRGSGSSTVQEYVMNTKLKFWLSCAGVALALALAAVSVTSVIAQTTTAPGQHAHRHGKGFEALDTNKDTLISRDEAKGHRFLANKFDAIDINKDGYLSRDERAAFKAAHKGERGMHGKHGGKDHAALDTNSDQLISRAEAKGHPRLEKNFDAIDTNKDGQLSRDELKAFRATHHAQPKQ